MRQYYEAREILPDEIRSEIDLDFIRMDITDMLIPERAEVLQLIKDQFAGMNYTFVLHYCKHDTGGACVTENLL